MEHLKIWAIYKSTLSNFDIVIIFVRLYRTRYVCDCESLSYDKHVYSSISSFQHNSKSLPTFSLSHHLTFHTGFLYWYISSDKVLLYTSHFFSIDLFQWMIIPYTHLIRFSVRKLQVILFMQYYGLSQKVCKQNVMSLVVHVHCI